MKAPALPRLGPPAFALSLALVAVSLAVPPLAGAGEADVLDVEVRRQPGGTYAFRVTVRHADEGWDHYADRWEVVGPNGEVLATRVLRHPHVHEQPFARGLRRVRIPEGVDRVTVRAHDSVHGLGGEEETVEVPRPRPERPPRSPEAPPGDE